TLQGVEWSEYQALHVVELQYGEISCENLSNMCSKNCVVSSLFAVFKSVGASGVWCLRKLFAPTSSPPTAYSVCANSNPWTPDGICLSVARVGCRRQTRPR
ncbi:unnamed protein product, partial [Ectocarpus sp. 12 AP-2014]